MKLYRFLSRGFAMNRIIEAGEEVLMADNTVPSAHMVDVRAESEAELRGEALPGTETTRAPTAVFRSDLAHDPATSVVQEMPTTITTADGAVLTYDPERKVYGAAPVAAAPEPVAEPMPDLGGQITETPVDPTAPADDPVDAQADATSAAVPPVEATPTGG